MNHFHSQDRLIETFRPDAAETDRRFNIQKSEALFGWSELPNFSDAPLSALEIGAGSGLLSMLVANQGPKVTALEPIADGFSHSEQVLASVEARPMPNLQILRLSIDDFETDLTFDFIWSVNVFEHLPDWRLALDKTYQLLKPGARCLILCPNYTIPYEPHFSLPIIGGKATTYRLFKKRIERYETTKEAHGLWQSLNFITARQVRQHCKTQNYQIEFDKTITARMFERFSDRAGVRERHKVLGRIIRVLNRTRISQVANYIPASLQPYMAITVSKPAAALTANPTVQSD